MAQLQRLVLHPDQFDEFRLTLTEAQHHYLTQVLRLRSGNRFVAMNGRGQWWLAQLEASTDQGLQARLLEPITIQTELPVSLTLVAALPKQGFDEVVRQATELGVAVILPVISDRTVLRPSPQKQERWQRIACEAAEQSERQVVPTIAEPLDFATYLQNLSGQARQSPLWGHYLGVTRHAAPSLMDCLIRDRHSSTLGHSELTLAIGPEGGWTEAEESAAIAAGFQGVSLGRRILRSVTAPLAALATIAAVYESDC